MSATTASTASANASAESVGDDPLTASETDAADGLAVLGLADGGEPDAEEERLRTEITGLVDDVDVVEVTLLGLLDERGHREPADAPALVVGVDVDEPQ